MTDALSTPLEAFAYINGYYGLDVRVGDEFLFCGRKGRIVEDHGNYLGVRIYPNPQVVSLHPVWSMEYLPRPATSKADDAPPDSRS